MESWAAPDWNPCPGGLRHALTFRQVSTHEVKLGHQRGCCSAKKKEPSSTSWVSVPRHKGDVQHNWYCDQVLKVNAESVRAWTEPLKQAIIFLRVGAVRTQDPQLGQLLVDLLKQLRFPHPVLIQSCLGLDHVFTQSWSCVPPPPSWSWLQHCPPHSTVNTLRPDIVLVFVSLGNSPSARGGLVGWGRGGEDSLHHRWD